MFVTRTARLLFVGFLLFTIVFVALAQQAKKSTDNRPAGYQRNWKIGPRAACMQTAQSTALTVVEYRFDKAVHYGQGGCITDERSSFSNILRCPNNASRQCAWRNCADGVHLHSK
jgi:hypothetical protein